MQLNWVPCPPQHEYKVGDIMQYLNATTVSSAPASVATPQYDRTGLTAGIVHFGVGGFHRTHQTMYLDRLNSSGKPTPS